MTESVRVTAHEKEGERVVLIRFLLVEVRGRYGTDRNRGWCHAAGERARSQVVGHPPKGDLSQPSRGH